MTRLDLYRARISRALSQSQGLAGVACLTGGTYTLVGYGYALLVLGVFLIIGAWGQR